MERISESLFQSFEMLSQKELALIGGGDCVDTTGPGSGYISGGGKCKSWTSDAFYYNNAGKLTKAKYVNPRMCTLPAG